MSAQKRISLEGTTQPIVARVLSAEGDCLVVGRKLPFLKLGAKVLDDTGRAGAIRGVSLRIEDGVPHLSLELEYEEVRKEPPPPAVVASARRRRDPTLGYEMRSSRPPAASTAPSLDDTNHDGTLGYAGQAFRPSLAPMPLPIPEAPPPEPAKAGLAAFFAMLAALLLPWLRPMPLLGLR
jgi:hypothetical protein